jgi:hypothetical protein
MLGDRRGVAIDDFVQLVVVLIFFSGVVVFLVVSTGIQERSDASNVLFSRGQDEVHSAGIAYLSQDIIFDGNEMTMAEFLQQVRVEGVKQQQLLDSLQFFRDQTKLFFDGQFPAPGQVVPPWRVHVSVDGETLSYAETGVDPRSTEYDVGTPRCSVTDGYERFTLPSPIHGTFFVDICVLSEYFTGDTS